MKTVLKLNDEDDASELCNCKDLKAQMRDQKGRLDRLEANFKVMNKVSTLHDHKNLKKEILEEVAKNFTKSNQTDRGISLKNATDLVEQVTELRANVLTNTQRKLQLYLFDNFLVKSCNLTYPVSYSAHVMRGAIH